MIMCVCASYIDSRFVCISIFHALIFVLTVVNCQLMVECQHNDHDNDNSNKTSNITHQSVIIITNKIISKLHNVHKKYDGKILHIILQFDDMTEESFFNV